MRDTVSEETCRREAFGIPLVGWLLLVCECEGGSNLESRPTKRRTGILDGIPLIILVLFTQTRPNVWEEKSEREPTGSPPASSRLSGLSARR